MVNYLFLDISTFILTTNQYECTNIIITYKIQKRKHPHPKQAHPPFPPPSTKLERTVQPGRVGVTHAFCVQEREWFGLSSVATFSKQFQFQFQPTPPSSRLETQLGQVALVCLCFGGGGGNFWKFNFDILEIFDVKIEC